MADDRSYKRKILLIKPALQYKFIGLVTAAVVVGVAIIAVDMFTSLGRYLMEAGGDVSGVYADTKFSFFVKIVVYLGGVLLVSLAVSHKVAGPVYRFEKSANDVAQGDLTAKVFLRKGDELLDLRDGFNAMVTALRDRVSTDSSRAYHAKQLLADVLQNPALPADAAEKLRQAMAEAEKIGKSFRV